MLSVIVGLLLQASAPPPSEEIAPLPVTLTNSDWRRMPGGADFRRTVAKFVKDRTLSGVAIIRCGVDNKGLVVDCAVVEETPAGNGFGEAALNLADRFAMWPRNRSGVPVGGGTVRIPIAFQGKNPR